MNRKENHKKDRKKKNKEILQIKKKEELFEMIEENEEMKKFENIYVFLERYQFLF